MRKLTPEERAAKKALARSHDENYGHGVAEAPVAEETPAEEAVSEEATPEDKPKRKKKAEEATVAEEASQEV